jgi:hypothetical protein
MSTGLNEANERDGTDLKAIGSASGLLLTAAHWIALQNR